MCEFLHSITDKCFKTYPIISKATHMNEWTKVRVGRGL